MWAMVVKEFRQLRRDRRTLAMMIVMPVVLLIVFGYAASFDVSSIPTAAAGPGAASAVRLLGKPFDLASSAPAEGRGWAMTQLRDGHAAVAIVSAGPGSKPAVLIDGSQLFTAKAALAALGSAEQRLAALRQVAGAPGGASPNAPPAAARPSVTVLYNPGLTTSAIMIPGLAGVILVFIGTIITSLGVVRERQSGTLEQLAVMPLRPRDVFLGKIAPYFAVAAVDLAIVVGIGVAVFNVPFRGSLAVFALGAVLFLFVTLGLGVLISSVSENQGQAIQLSMMITLPQVLLSGLIFPLSSIPIGVRWISYMLPLTYFNEISRGVMLRAEPLGSLWEPMLYLTLLGVVVVTLATLRFRSYLAPAGGGRGRRGKVPPPALAGDPGADGLGSAVAALRGTVTGPGTGEQ
jgi:ABC-2 type transport system permease protein